ncbi:MAG: hypothetical protein IT373_01655 [Polyangiaceae bacterium]|nr:hypothetical protein [Polyangiaceae bacterium]
MKRLVGALDRPAAARFAAACAERVLAFFEAAHPEDDRPRTAIEVARAGAPVAVARAAASAAHAAARAAADAVADPPAGAITAVRAVWAARAAGHAAASLHVATHAAAAAHYAARAAADPAERRWQWERLQRVVGSCQRSTVGVTSAKGAGISRA